MNKSNPGGNAVVLQRRSGYALRNLPAQHPFATPRAALGPPAAPAPRYHGHSASALPPQPRLPDHVASFGAAAAPAHADELTFNSTIKDRVTSEGCFLCCCLPAGAAVACLAATMLRLGTVAAMRFPDCGSRTPTCWG